MKRKIINQKQKEAEAKKKEATKRINGVIELFASIYYLIMYLGISSMVGFGIFCIGYLPKEQITIGLVFGSIFAGTFAFVLITPALDFYIKQTKKELEVK